MSRPDDGYDGTDSLGRLRTLCCHIRKPSGLFAQQGTGFSLARSPTRRLRPLSTRRLLSRPSGSEGLDLQRPLLGRASISSAEQALYWPMAATASKHHPNPPRPCPYQDPHDPEILCLIDAARSRAKRPSRSRRDQLQREMVPPWCRITTLLCRLSGNRIHSRSLDPSILSPPEFSSRSPKLNVTLGPAWEARTIRDPQTNFWKMPDIYCDPGETVARICIWPESQRPQFG